MKIIAIVILCAVFYIGCETANAEYKTLYQEQVQVTDSLQSNLDLLYFVADSIKQSNVKMRGEIMALNAKIDSLDLFYADLKDAKDTQDSMLTIINNSFIDYIKKLRIGD